MNRKVFGFWHEKASWCGSRKPPRFVSIPGSNFDSSFDSTTIADFVEAVGQWVPGSSLPPSHEYDDPDEDPRTICQVCCTNAPAIIFECRSKPYSMCRVCVESFPDMKFMKSSVED